MRMGIAKIYKGDMVVKKTDGYVYQAYTAGAAGDQFCGVAAETIDNTLGSAGDKQIRVWLEGTFEFALAAAGNINAILGVIAYVEDGSVGAGTPTTVTITAPAAQPMIAGRIVELIPPTAGGAMTACVRCRVRISSFSAIAA